MTLIDPSSSPQEPGRRYLLTPADDRAATWEVGWAQPLGAFYAQQVDLLDDDTAVEIGPKIFEPTAFERLAEHIGRPIPADVAHSLHQDALNLPAGLSTTATLADWAASVYRQLGIAPRWSLPAAPVVDVIREHRAEWGNQEPLKVASGMGLDHELATGMLNGTIDHLNVAQIAHACDVLRCSPFDLWGTDLARSILHVYGPEHWPRYIEPLQEQARPRLIPAIHELEQPTHRADSSPLDDPSTRDPGTVDGLLTPYRWAGVIALNTGGEPIEDREAAYAAQEVAEYRLTFKQAADPRPTPLPAEWIRDATDSDTIAPHLAANASALRQELDQPHSNAVLLVRITWSTGGEAWLGWNRSTKGWELWNDPRHTYPGSPTDILDAGRFADPTRGLPVAHVQPPAPHQRLNDAADEPSFAPGSDAIVTGYRRTALFAVDSFGEKFLVTDTAPSADASEYHFAFEQVTRPSIYALFGCEESSAGDGVDPFLASVASYRVSDVDTGGDTNAKIELVRISPTINGKFTDGPETWLGWHPETKTWELWDDPRRHYTGVLDPGNHIEPEQWDATKEMEAINAHDTHGLTALSDDDTQLDGQEWTQKWADEPHHVYDPPGLEL
jgi:hypothetical protein